METNQDKTLGEFLKDMGIADKDIKESLDHINEEEFAKRKLAKCIEEDIQQYLPDTGAIWGDESVVVKIKDDIAYAVWREHWMPTTGFYKLVYENGGVVEPKDFEKY
jgi:hypothetical protein